MSIVKTLLCVLVFFVTVFIETIQAQAGCGCDKIPPALAAVRPQAASAGTPVSLFSPKLRVGLLYAVVFTSGTTGLKASVQTRAVLKRDLADGQLKPHLIVPAPNLPLGPTGIGVSLTGQLGTVLSVSDSLFTVIPRAMVISGRPGTYSFPNRQAAVSRDGIVYLSLDLSQVTSPLVIQGQAKNYPLRFTSNDVVFYNAQGFLMQLLEQNIPGLFSIGMSPSSGESDILRYSRHEFNTFYLQHNERQRHALDLLDPNWHTDGTPHIDHDNLVLAISGSINGGPPPPAGATPAFEFKIETFSLFQHALFASGPISMGDKSGTYGYNSKGRGGAGGGRIRSNEVVALSGHARVVGDVTAPRIRVEDKAGVTGAITQTKGIFEVMPVVIPASLEHLGSLVLRDGDSITLTGPGSFEVTEIVVEKKGELFIDNVEGPVTLYVTGQIRVKDQGEISVADPDPENFSIYVAGREAVVFSGAKDFSGLIYAPRSVLHLSEKSSLFGAFVAQKIDMADKAEVFFDTALSGGQSVTPASTKVPALKGLVLLEKKKGLCPPALKGLVLLKKKKGLCPP
jgi:hypothetical protein